MVLPLDADNATKVASESAGINFKQHTVQWLANSGLNGLVSQEIDGIKVIW